MIIKKYASNSVRVIEIKKHFQWTRNKEESLKTEKQMRQKLSSEMHKYEKCGNIPICEKQKHQVISLPTKGLYLPSLGKVAINTTLGLKNNVSDSWQYRSMQNILSYSTTSQWVQVTVNSMTQYSKKTIKKPWIKLMRKKNTMKGQHIQAESRREEDQEM